MELNKSAEMNEPPLLAIGRQSYDMVAAENEHQAGSSAWSPMDCNGGGPSSMNEIWHADWRPYPGDLSHTQSLQAQHRAKRQHCWGATSMIPEEQGVGSSTSRDEDSLKSLHTDLFGCCETSNAGNAGFDFFQSTPNSASSSRSSCPPHSSMLVNNSRQVTTNGTGHWNASVGQGGVGSFFADGDWTITKDLMSSESTESKKGKGVEHLHTNVGGSGIELSGCQESTYFSNVLATQQDGEKGKSGIPIDCMSKQRAEAVHTDFRGAIKRKISPVDFAETSPFDSRFAAASESAATRTEFGTSADQSGFTPLYPIGNPSTMSLWGDPRLECTEYACNDSQSSRGAVERTSSLVGSGEDTSRSFHNQPYSLPSDTQSQSQLLFTRNLRRSVQAHSFTRRNSDPVSGNVANSTSLLVGSDHWPALGVDRTPAPLPAMGSWGPSSGSRRTSSAFTSPSVRERGSSQGAFEGSRFRSMPGRTIDWAMAAATTAAPAGLEHRPTSQFFASGGVAAPTGPTGREADPSESSARITQAAASFFNSGIMGSYFPPSGSSNSRVNMNPPPPVSAAPSHQIPAGPLLEASAAVAGQHAGRYATVSPSRGRREALFSGPVQSVLGLPFRGLHTLRADGEYRRQFLSEILNAMHHAFRSEDLNIDELVMLDPSIIYGGGDAHDQHRDMRLDVDNMTYEELLALEERIGNVNTGLDEEKICLCLRESKYSSLDATVAAISQDSDVKCSVCQEEFVEEEELGRLDCGHGYHSACIKQWLVQKNECPICKAPAYIKP